MKMYPYSLDFTDSRGDILTVVKKLKKEVFEGKNTCCVNVFCIGSTQCMCPYPTENAHNDGEQAI